MRVSGSPEATSSAPGRTINSSATTSTTANRATAIHLDMPTRLTECFRRSYWARFGSNGLRGDDGDQKRDGHADKNEARLTGVHEHPEDERRRRQPGIESGIHQPVNASECACAQARRGGFAHEHVSRWAGDTYAKTHHGHDADHGPTRN